MHFSNMIIGYIFSFYINSFLTLCHPNFTSVTLTNTVWRATICYKICSELYML